MKSMSFIVILALTMAGAAGIAQADDSRANTASKPQETFDTIATLPCNIVSINGLRSKGFRISRAGASEPNKSRFTISIGAKYMRADIGGLRVLARDKNGKLHKPISQWQLPGALNKGRVVMLLCKFPLPENKIQELVIRKKSIASRGVIMLGGVTARIIIQEEEEALLGIDLP